MTDSNEVYRDVDKDSLTEIERSQGGFEGNEESNQSHDVPLESSLKSEEVLTSPVENTCKEESEGDVLDNVRCEKEDNSSVFIKTLLTSTETPKTSQEVCQKLNNEGYSLAPKQEIELENCDQFAHPRTLSEVESDKVETAVSSKSEAMGMNASSQADKENSTPNEPPSYRVPESYIESSRSSSSELQADVPFETSNSSQENIFVEERLNFENAIHPESSEDWRKEDNSTVNEESGLEGGTSNALEQHQRSEQTGQETPLGIDETTQHSRTNGAASPSVSNIPATMETVFPISLPPSEGTLCDMLNNKPEVKTEQPPPEPPAPVVPPAPRKRGRPRKQVLPNPSPLVESWGSNAQEFPSADQSKERKRSTRTERRATKRKKFDDESQDGDEETPKRRFNLKQPVKKKKRRATYTPKKRGPPPKKKHSEMENIQNFEEETRMSASEGHGGFSSKSGGMGDESQGSSVTEGMTKSNINKKGRMEVMTDGCKPVTVQQIVEYYWPPPSSLPHGEKPEGLMIQEQITEYLGVKSFKRKYPSIKRRPVDMEERNYLQENGFVSENMCDMGLTAVFSADIIEIMYNDFPQKFEEYRKYTREKKAKEQRALREKQAAERADMDPVKEAVESTVSWNSEFNKTRRYNSKVLMGNWFDRNCNEEHKLAMYLKKKERKQLLIVKLRKLFDNFLRHVPLSLPTKGLAYGGSIQLLAPDVISGPSYDSERGSGVVLAATIDPDEVDRVQSIVEDLRIVGSPLKESCARNTFKIESCEGKEEGRAVCYGDTFTLKLADDTDFPLYVELGVYSLGVPTGKCGFPTPSLRIYRSRDARFKVVHPSAEMRVWTDGTPCSPFERVVVQHAPDNEALCVEDEHWTMSLFSYECEISGHTKIDLKKRHAGQNLWMFLVGSAK